MAKVRFINPATGFDSEKKRKKEENGIGKPYRPALEVERRKKQEELKKKETIAERPTIARNSIDLLKQVSAPERMQAYHARQKGETPERDAVDMMKEMLRAGAAVPETRNPIVTLGDYVRKQQAEELEKNKGWKRVGNQTVYATPFSPLPKPAKDNTATRAKAPGAFGIAPKDYAGMMGNIDRYNALVEKGAPKADGMDAVESEEGKRFLNKWFPEKANAGTLPTEDEVRTKYTQLDPWQQDTYWMEWMANEAALSPLMTQDVETDAYDRELGEAKAARDETLKVLGPDAEKFATGRTADYYERYGNEYRAMDRNTGDEPYLHYGDMDGIDLETAKRYSASPYIGRGQGYDLQRWAVTSPKQREKYELIKNIYGGEAADEYLKSLQGELNQKLVREEATLAQQYANEHPFLSSLETMVTAPVRGAVALEGMAQEYLTGKQMDNYDPRLNMTRRAEAIRGQTAQNIGGGVGGFLYQTLMSIGDNVANMALMGGLGSTAVGTLMFGSSFASAFNDAIDRTGSHDQAMMAGVLSGAAEMAFEKYSIEGFFDMLQKGRGGKAVLDVLRQMGVEASEEGATAIANEIGDRLVMGEKSHYENNVANMMMQGMPEEEARKAANIESAKEIGLSMAGGAVSGGVMGGIGQGINYISGGREQSAQPVQETQQTEQLVEPVRVEREITGKRPEQEAQTEAPVEPVRVEREITGKRPEQEAQTEAPVEPVRVEREITGKRPEQEAQTEAPVEPVRVEREITGKRPAQGSDVSQQEAQAAQPDKQESQTEKPVQVPSKTEKGKTFRVERAVTVRRNGMTQGMNVTGVEDVSGGSVFLRAKNEDGDAEIVSAADVEFADPVQQELMNYKGLGRMDAVGVRGYLEGYDAGIATPEQYAQAFESAYEDGKAGIGYEKMLKMDVLAARHLTGNVRQIAWAAGDRANLMNARSTKYQKIVTETLNKAAGGKIRFVDEAIEGNGYYDHNTGEIVISKNADKGAYAYIAVHELGHKLKAENAEAWGSFQTLVEDALLVNGVDIDERIAQTKKLYSERGQELTTEEALEEVICNSAASILQDEKIVKDMIAKDRSLMERVADFLREFVDRLASTIAKAGEDMSELGSWKQLDALKADHENLQKIYQNLMDGLVETKNKENLAADEGVAVKMSAKEKLSYEEAQKAYEGKDLANDEEVYDYDFLIALPDIETSVEGNINDILKENGMIDHQMLKQKAMENAEKYGDKLGDKKGVIVRNDYTGHEIRVTGRGADHSTNNKDNPVANKINARAGLIIGELVKKAVPLNAEVDKAQNVRGTYLMAAPIQSKNGKILSTAVLTIEMRSGNLQGLEVYDQTHSLSVRKKNVAGLDAQASPVRSDHKDRSAVTRSAYSIAEFLEIVHSTHQSLLSEDVLEHYEEKRNEKGHYNGRVKFSMKEDSDGNALTEEQQEYFANSKVRDKSGNLMVMYHGTPNGKYDRFRSATYFTPMKEYADVYQSPGASSISVKRNADDPKTYKAYLNIEKPFDTRNAKERRIFMNEYYRKWGTGAPLAESGLPDWTDGMDLQEFIEEMGYDYDGLILDEGGVPDDKGGVKSRGLSYVIFDPAQAKVTENKTPTKDERFRYSIRETSEAVQEELQQTVAAFEQVRHAHRITPAEADGLAGKMLKEANSAYDRATLASEIAQIYDYVENAESINMDYMDDMQTALMARVMDKSKVLDEEHEQMVDPIREYLKGTRIRFTDTQRKEAANISGSYGAYRREVMGRLKLVSMGGTDLDVVWEELHDINPEWFPEDTPEGDMPGMLLEVVDALKPVYMTGMNTEETASWMAGKLNEAYLSLPAVKAAARSQKGFSGSVRDMRMAMKRFEETSAEDFDEALRMLEESRRKAKDETDREALSELRRQYDEWKAKDADKREERFQLELKRAKDKMRADDLAMRRVYMQVIQKGYERQRMKDSADRRERELVNKQRARTEATVRTLLNWMDKPTDAKHVPADLEEPLKDVLSALDFGGKNTKVSTELSQRLERLATVIEGAQEGEDENRTMFLERDQQMVDELRRVAQMIAGNTGGRGVYELKGAELRDLNKWLGVVKHVLVNAGKMRGSNFDQDVQQVAAESIFEISKKKPMKDKKWITKQWENLFGVDMLDSFAFFERLGRTSTMVFDGLRKGFDQMARYTKQAETYTKELLKGADLKKLTGRKAEKLTFEMEESGRTIEMTRAQIMELYVLNRREQARGHIYGDGILIRGDEDAHAHVVTERDVENITSVLTDEEKKIAEGMQKFLAKICGKWGNETSLKLLGYEKFGEENYWPISTDPNTRNTTRLEDNFAANISAIKNQGMTKQLIEGARNAIMIGDIFDSYTRHISNMSAYASYAIPLSDFTRWYNSRGLKIEIAHVMGQKGLAYINNLLMAINGTAQKTPLTGPERVAGMLARNAKTASVGANVRVAIQQPTSYARAAMYISPKYLAEALGAKLDDAELVNKYCGIAAWKRYGFRETNVGPNLREMIVGDKSALEKGREISMKMAEWGDNWTLNRLWAACKLETDETMPELAKGSEEYYRHVGERMSEIIDRTQVVDSPFHRSQMMRSKSFLAQTLTNFMSEPTKTYNMLASAIYDYADNRKNKAARERLAKTFVVYGMSAVLTAAAAGIVDAFRSSDDGKDWLEKYRDAVMGNTLDGLNPLGMLPLVRDVLSTLEGYDSNRLDQQSVQRIVWAGQEIAKYANGESKMNWYGVAYKVAQAMSSVVGVPVSNFMRDANALVQTATGMSPTLNAEGQKGSYINQLYAAMQKGDSKKDASIRQKLRTEAGMSPKDIDTAIADKLSYEERIAKAWTAKKGGRVGDVNRTKNELSHEGFTGEMVDRAITAYGNRVEPKEKKEKDMDAQLKVKLYSYDDAMVAINAGASVADIKAMMSDMEADSTAKDPGKTVRSELQSRIKKEYQAAYEKGDKMKMDSLNLVLHEAVGTKPETIEKWKKEWNKKK